MVEKKNEFDFLKATKGKLVCSARLCEGTFYLYLFCIFIDEPFCIPIIIYFVPVTIYLFVFYLRKYMLFSVKIFYQNIFA